MKLTDIVYKHLPTHPPINFKCFKKYIIFSDLYRSIKNKKGDIVECGTGEGWSTMLLAYCIRMEFEETGVFRQLWSFDSFQGFPEPMEYDESKRCPKKGEWNHVREKKVRRLISRTGFPKKKFHLIKGFFNISLDQFTGKNIALLNLDVDLYSSYKDCISKLLPKVIPGGIIIFDEYNDEKWPGATKAILKYFSKENIQKINDTWYTRL